MKNPPHPGDFIRTEIVEPTGLSVTAATAVLQVSRPALSNLLNSKADLSGEMALRIETAFGVKKDGYADADAGILQHRTGPEVGERNPRQALSKDGGRSSIVATTSILAVFQIRSLPPLRFTTGSRLPPEIEPTSTKQE